MPQERTAWRCNRFEFINYKELLEERKADRESLQEESSTCNTQTTITTKECPYVRAILPKKISKTTVVSSSSNANTVRMEVDSIDNPFWNLALNKMENVYTRFSRIPDMACNEVKRMVCFACSVNYKEINHSQFPMKCSRCDLETYCYILMDQHRDHC